MSKEKVIEKIENAIFECLRKEFPEAKSGDVDPIKYCNFKKSLHSMVDDWILNNT